VLPIMWDVGVGIILSQNSTYIKKSAGAQEH
jgi:hypothetical protein